jgi:hypothetical protein
MKGSFKSDVSIRSAGANFFLSIRRDRLHKNRMTQPVPLAHRLTFFPPTLGRGDPFQLALPHAGERWGEAGPIKASFAAIAPDSHIFMLDV